MEVRDYEEIKKKLCKELEEIKSHKTMGMAEIEIIDKLTNSIKNLGKIIEMDEGSYSYAGYGRSYGTDGRSFEGRYDGQSYRDSYDGNFDHSGSSYARRGMHYVRGHYSHAGDNMDMVMDQLQEMMDSSNMSLDDKSTLRRAMEVLRK